MRKFRSPRLRCGLSAFLVCFRMFSLSVDLHLLQVALHLSCFSQRPQMVSYPSSRAENMVESILCCTTNFWQMWSPTGVPAELSHKGPYEQNQHKFLYEQMSVTKVMSCRRCLFMLASFSQDRWGYMVPQKSSIESAICASSPAWHG